METEPQREPLAVISLSGGRLTPGIVRVGNTVRRPAKGNAAFVHDLLLFLEDQDFPFAPRFFGRDEQGRDILSYLEGFSQNGSQSCAARMLNVPSSCNKPVSQLGLASGGQAGAEIGSEQRMSGSRATILREVASPSACICSRPSRSNPSCWITGPTLRCPFPLPSSPPALENSPGIFTRPGEDPAPPVQLHSQQKQSCLVLLSRRPGPAFHRSR